MRRPQYTTALSVLLFLLAGCAETGVPKNAFLPKSDYPPDPWVKGYTDPQDCIGGEKLAARKFALPKYPKKAFKKGLQGWVLLRLDVDAGGKPRNVHVERALPGGSFDKNARQAAERWLFRPPAKPLENCRVLLRYRLGGVSLGG